MVTRVRMPRGVAVLATAAACALLLAGCGGGGENAVAGFAGGTSSKDKQPIPPAVESAAQPGAPEAPATLPSPAPVQEPAVADKSVEPEASHKTAEPIRTASNEYRSTSRRDPFASLIGSDERSDLVDLSVVRLVGVVTSGAKPFAIVEDTEGVSYVLRKGDRVKNGRVVRVTSEGLVCSQTLLGYTTTVQLKLEHGKDVKNG